MNTGILRILVVDDDEDDYVITRDLLAEVQGPGFDLDWIASYAAALEAIGHNQHDVYFLDYRLGEHSGLELLKEAMAKGCKAPMILLTGQGDHEVDIEAMRAGAFDYLVKGRIDSSLLERSIRYALDRKRTEEALQQAKLQLEEANQTLEDRVRQRTQELEEANKQILEAQDQLVRSAKLAAIGQLAGGVAHDLRNPLGAIKNAVYYLKRRLSASELAQSDPKIGQFLQIVDEEVEHSNQIIADLLTFARVGTPSLSPTNLGEIVGNALSSLEVRGNVHVVKQFAPDLPEVLADGEHLYRVFMNLAVNAQEAMIDGGELTISARRVDGFAEVAFSDTGIGITDEDMKKIFEPLFTTKTKGTGLGLAVCQQIMSKHSGDIDVATKQGEGTTFTVRLPLNVDDS